MADNMDRGDFLKKLGVAGLAGVGMALGGAGAARAEEAKKTKYVVAITSGGNNPNRAILGLLLAQAAAKKGLGQIHVWLTLEGAEVAHRDKCAKISSSIYAKFGNALELVNDLKERGVSFGICPPCADYFGAVDEKKFEFVEKAGGDWLMENIRDAEVVWL